MRLGRGAVGLVLLLVGAAQAQQQTALDFVVDGAPRAVATLGPEWSAGQGYLEAVGRSDLAQRLLGRCVIGSGDFRVQARLSILRLAGSAAVFSLGSANYFGFAGGHGKVFLTGPIFNKPPGAPIGEPGDFMKEGAPFDFEVSRSEGRLRYSIDGKTVHEQPVGAEALGAPGFVPYRATMRVYSFRATGNLGPYSAPAVAAASRDNITLDRRLKPLPGLPQGPFVRLKDNVILTVQDREVLTSRDEGKSWERRPLVVTSGTAAQRKLSVRPERALLRTQAGSLVLLCLDDAALHYSWDKGKNLPLPDMHLPSYALRSTDEGRTWGDLTVLTDGWCGCLQDLCQTRGGTLVAPGQELLYKEGRHATMPYYSTDDGRTWQRTRYLDVGGQGDHAGLIEGTLEVLGGDRVWLLMRTPAGSLYEAVSADQGRTWSQQKPSVFPATSAPAKLERLASGRLVLLWNALPRAPFRTREELSISFSEDDGASWTTPQLVATNPGGRLSYIHVFERVPGELWVTTMQGGLRAVLKESDFVKPAPTVVAFGDSTTAPRAGLVVYADLLRQGLLARGLGAQVVNAGVGGDDTGDALLRLEKDVLAHKPAVAIVQFGINDAAVDVWKQPPATAPRVPLADYRRNLEQVLNRLGACGTAVVLMTPNPMCWTDDLRKAYGKAPYDPTSADGFNVLLRDYVAVIREVAAARELPLVDVFALFEGASAQAGGLGALLPDGMHPGQSGHDLVAARLLEVVAPLVESAASLAIAWREGAPLPVPVGGHATGAVGGRLLLAGGTTWTDGVKHWLADIRAYDAAADRWTQLGALPEPVGYAVAAADGKGLYVLGGAGEKAASRHCYRVSAEGTAQALPDLPEARVFAAGALVEGTLYVAGGGSDPARLDSATNTLYALRLDDLATGWRTLAPLPGPARVVHAAAGAGPYLYVFGGCRLDAAGTVRNLADAWRYDVHRGSWEALPDLPAANRALTAVEGAGGTVLLLGGYTATEEQAAGQGDAFGFTGLVLCYDPAVRSYRALGSLPAPNADARPAQVGAELVVTGGEPAKRRRAGSVWRTELAALR